MIAQIRKKEDEYLQDIGLIDFENVKSVAINYNEAKFRKHLSSNFEITVTRNMNILGRAIPQNE